ncbi:MAG TPA: bifunctional DNA-formamidopyrimidine glycosylase/DNA-(apurinic or apyrimidinic site) lyase [Actinomycetota bacterium]|nr:bifunctional DNA-formamidopyrimidine glycosylase/DNA-(apurinic or apyrimidinic site) lyase [Actinomycetota bacterium]
MPELPEVEVVRRGLQDWTPGRRVRDVEVLHPRAVRRHPGTVRDFENAVRGRDLTSVERRGKFLWWPLTDVALVGHLGMSGQFRVAARPGPHTRIRFDLGVPLLFDDQRTFGGMWIEPVVDGRPESLHHIAPDPFSEDFDRRAVVRRIRSSTAAIKSLLLDQRVVSGIGNIYADEALWQARVHWRTPGSALSARKAGFLIDAAGEVMRRALAAGGTSFDELYVDVAGDSGYFQRELMAYGREGMPCPRCGQSLVREPFAGRSSHRCPRCQRMPD